MYSPRFPFTLLSVAIAQLFLSESGQTAVPESIPSTLYDSPFPIGVNPDIESSSYDFGNINPSPMNLVASNPTVPTDQLLPGTSPFTANALSSGFKPALPSNDMKTESILQHESLNTHWPTGLEHSDPSCNSLSTTSGRKVRRGDSCEVADRVGELFNWLQREYEKARDYLVPLGNEDTQLTDMEW